MNQTPQKADKSPGKNGAEPLDGITWKDLPEKVRAGLSLVPRAEWGSLIVVKCTTQLSEDFHQLVALRDQIRAMSRRAEDFVQGRLTGVDRDAEYEQVKKLMSGLATSTFHFSKKAQAFPTVMRQRNLLERYIKDLVGEVPRPGKKPGKKSATGGPTKPIPQGTTPPPTAQPGAA